MNVRGLEISELGEAQARSRLCGTGEQISGDLDFVNVYTF